MRIVHLSDLHVWRYTWDPRRLASHRFFGMIELLRGRAGRFHLDRIEPVIARVRALEPEHVLITGDLTTTALPAEFEAARVALAPLLEDPHRVTVVPGNHDRSTSRSLRSRRFEEMFGAYMPKRIFPWLRPLDPGTAILGLDATRSHVMPTGLLPAEQLAEARSLIADPLVRPHRLIVACHYPLVAPPLYQDELARKRMLNGREVIDWLSGIGPHLYCCGHVHAAWAYRSPEWPEHFSINPGAPLMHDPTGFRLPGFLELLLKDEGVTVTHHAWDGHEWVETPLAQDPTFFAQAAAPAAGP